MFTSLGMLDCGPQPDFWDDFFAPRWPGLTTGPVEAVAARAETPGGYEFAFPMGFCPGKQVVEQEV